MQSVWLGDDAMMMQDVETLIAEVDALLATSKRAWRSATLRRLTELWREGADSWADEHIAVIDRVMARFLDKADRKTLAELSLGLAQSERPPRGVLTRLSCHDAMEISGPILEKSPALADTALAEICRTKGVRHVAAIARRARMGDTVTDAIIERGDARNYPKLAANADAALSEMGFVRLISSAKNDRNLARAIAARSDIPAELEPFVKVALGEAA